MGFHGERPSTLPLPVTVLFLLTRLRQSDCGGARGGRRGPPQSRVVLGKGRRAKATKLAPSWATLLLSGGFWNEGCLGQGLHITALDPRDARAAASILTFLRGPDPGHGVLRRNGLRVIRCHMYESFVTNVRPETTRNLSKRPGVGSTGSKFLLLQRDRPSA